MKREIKKDDLADSNTMKEKMNEMKKKYEMQKEDMLKRKSAQVAQTVSLFAVQEEEVDM